MNFYYDILEERAIAGGWGGLQEQAKHIVSESWPASENAEEIAERLINAAIERRSSLAAVVVVTEDFF